MTKTETATFNFDAMTAQLSNDRAIAEAELHEAELTAYTLQAELAAQSAHTPIAPVTARNGAGDLWRSLQINDSAVITLTGRMPSGNAMSNPTSTKAIAFKRLQDAIARANGANLRVIDIVNKRGVARSYLAWFGQDTSVAYDGLTGAALPRKPVPSA